VGRSLVPLLRGESLPEEPAVAERARGPRPLDALRLGDWKLIQEPAQGSARLYDVRSDPREEHDLAAMNPQEVARLRGELERLKARARERGERHATTRALSFTPGVEDDLESLGYAGDEPEPPREGSR